MKNRLYILSAIVMITLISCASAKNKSTEKFTVYGNCGMCETTIEDALNMTKGVVYADWIVETKLLTVKYDTTKLSLEEIKQKVADVGYDSDSHRAKDAVYNKLHGCCQYDRPKGK